MSPMVLRRKIVGYGIVVVGLGISGCNLDRVSPGARAPRAAVYESVEPTGRTVRSNAPVDVTPVESREVDLVENVALHRAEYVRHLERLRDYYKDKGYATKQSWADFELQGVRKVKQFRYLADSEVPNFMLRPTESIAEADALFERGISLMRKGGHGIPIFYRQKHMIEAAEVLRSVVDRHPTSDKVDDAAFFLGEIHKEYLPNQEPIAVMWYERAFAWNPQTSHPARFQAAIIYDYRLHDRDKALELYHAVVVEESANKSNVRFAQRRMDELSSGRKAVHARPG